MNKLLLVAALGSVEACPLQDYYNSMKAKCPETDAPKLNEVQLNRLFMKNSYQGFVTGIYSENDKVVPDECFGAWIEAPIHKVKDLHHKMHEDFWSVNINDVKDVGSELIDVFYKNTEVCHFERIQDDAKHWCVENPGQCIFMENMEERIFDNMFEIMGKMWDISKLMNTDDDCYTDIEQMAELYRFANDMGEIVASLSGFDYKWDQSVERKHIKKRAFHSQIKDLYMNYQYKNVDPLELMFPDVYEFLKGIEQQVEQFFHDLHESHMKFAAKFQPHHNQHHHSLNKQFSFLTPEMAMPEMAMPVMKMPEMKMPEFPQFSFFPPMPKHTKKQHHQKQHHHNDWSHFKLF